MSPFCEDIGHTGLGPRMTSLELRHLCRVCLSKGHIVRYWELGLRHANFQGDALHPSTLMETGCVECVGFLLATSLWRPRARPWQLRLLSEHAQRWTGGTAELATAHTFEAHLSSRAPPPATSALSVCWLLWVPVGNPDKADGIASLMMQRNLVRRIQ